MENRHHAVNAESSCNLETEMKWYHNIELEPGEITKGFGFHNVSIARKMLAAVDIAGRTVIDVGCADAMLGILAFRRNAARVIAWDRVERPTHDVLRDKLGCTQLESVEEPDFRKVSQLDPADVVICSGMLYHVYDPLATILRVRGLVRTGGVLIIETAVYLDEKPILQWNGGKFYETAHAGNYWFPSVGVLNEWMAFLRVVPLAASWIDETRGIGRLALACRAVDCVSTSDPWKAYHQGPLVGSDTELCFREVIDWDRCKSNAAPVTVAGGSPIASLWDWTRKNPPMPAAEIARGIVCRLGDTE
jgi:hypothetical protein